MAGSRCCDHGFAHCLFGKLPLRGTLHLLEKVAEVVRDAMFDHCSIFF